MKLARVVVSHKGGSFNDLNNYIPISVLCFFFFFFQKIAENIMPRRITAFLTAHNILAEEQYGFRKDKSAETALLEEKLLQNIEEKK